MGGDEKVFWQLKPEFTLQEAVELWRQGCALRGASLDSSAKLEQVRHNVVCELGESAWGFQEWSKKPQLLFPRWIPEVPRYTPRGGPQRISAPPATRRHDKLLSPVFWQLHIWAADKKGLGGLHNKMVYRSTTSGCGVAHQPAAYYHESRLVSFSTSCNK